MAMKDTRTLSQRWADSVTEFSGSWAFIGWFSAICLIWIALNVSGLVKWDLFPFLLLNGALTVISTFQNPLILLSQNRQNENDRATVQEILKRLSDLQDTIDQMRQEGK